MSDQEVLLIDWYEVYGYDMSFKFKFARQTTGDIFIYILSQPSYRSNQASDGHTTHRYNLNSGPPFICYDPMPRNMKDAKVIAGEWAKRTAYYIRNGIWKNKGE